MKYTSEILIKSPIEELSMKLRDYNSMKYWQRGLESFEHIHGELGALGSKIKLNYKFGSRKICLVETVSHCKFPYEYHVYHDSEGIYNIYKNYFEEAANGFTKWIFESEFNPTTFSMSMKTLLMPSLYKKQTIIYLKDFKNFVENGVSVLEYA